MPLKTYSTISAVKFFTLLLIVFGCSFSSCKKSNSGAPTDPPPGVKTFNLTATLINNAATPPFKGISRTPAISLSFSAALDRNSAATNLVLKSAAGQSVAINYNYTNNDNTVQLSPAANLTELSKFTVEVLPGLIAKDASKISMASSVIFSTGLDSSRKFAAIPDSVLLDKVQQQTLKYFYDFGHPISGLARERNSSGETCTSGGSGFGIMALIVGVNRNFISKPDGFARIQKIVSFLKNTAETVHGAFPHWLNGTTGAIIPFSGQDNGADLVETSFLAQGLICARQYFTGAGAEAILRTDINTILDRIEWDFFRQGGQQQLYWHYSNNNGWAINLKIKGWNEALMPYVMGASSTTHRIPASVYSNGWASNGSAGFLNGNSYYGYPLPLGPDKGGPLFFEHYSFLGINPNGLYDTYASYSTQTKNHTLINYNYCKANPLNYYGYSDSVWGLTASDIPGGYTASSPTNDRGIIAPTAALSSFPYTPVESMQALKFYYYVLGDKLFKEYGFIDAFSLDEPWFASSYLAIDQGPIIIMIENYRTKLLWNLFTGAPEIKAGMRTLGFSAPYLP